MTKPHFTIDQHRAHAAVLKQVRRQLMDEYINRLVLSYPQQGPESKAILKAIKAVEEVQNVMDNNLCREYRSVPNSEMGRVYYGPEV